ncbi:MAG: polysaccharide biosynthesis protein [Agathobacter sp.]|nr:polysaccharide biosynthesis protein [Agathobacter sp.]
MKTNKKMSPLILGTAILSAAGILSRLVGFLYRIFLSRTIGASALGLYQLVFPIVTLCYAISFAGIQTAISKYVAEGVARDSGKAGSGSSPLRYLVSGLMLSVGLSLICGALLYLASDRIAIHLLGESRCGALLRILSYSILPASIHSCINGYYYGQKKTAVPAIGQLVEQFARVGSVYLMFLITVEQGLPLTAAHAVWGIFFSEIAGLIVATTAISISTGSTCSGTKLKTGLRSGGASQSALSTGGALAAIGSMALPLTINQTLMHLFSSFENLLIPQRLQAYGCSTEDALSTYGVLSGMVVSVIFFPCVLTNSLSVLLLPSVSGATARGDRKKIDRIVFLSIRYGLLFGFVFTALFLLFGSFIGAVLFDNILAGILIRKLSWLCPMMYVYSLLCSVLHGLGRPKTVLRINLSASLIRICIILFLVPRHGLNALLWGMLISQLFSAIAAVIQVQNPRMQG